MAIYIHIDYKDSQTVNVIRMVADQARFRKRWLLNDNPPGFEFLQLIFNHGIKVSQSDVLLPLLEELANLKAFYIDNPPADMATGEIASLFYQLDFLVQKLEHVRDHPEEIVEAWMG